MAPTEFTDAEIHVMLDSLADSRTAYQRWPGDEDKREVILYLQPEAMDTPTGEFLPVIVVNGEQGCYPFDALFGDHVALAVAAFFGADPVVAQRRVNEINLGRGLTKEQVSDIKIQSFWQT
jgi:hypothetical protein